MSEFSELTNEMPRPRLEFYLLGAPGTKKTETANLFEERSRDWFSERGIAPLSVVDTNHLLAEKQGREVGVKGDHYVTLANHFNREQLQDRIRLRGDSFITCGSLIDSVAHLNVRLKLLSQMVQLPNTQAMAEREMLVGNLLQTYFMDGRWQMNFAWYLPLPEKIVLPGTHQDESTYDAEVDAILRDINLKLGLGVPILTGTVEQRAEAMLQTLDEKYTGAPREEDTVSE